MAVPFHSQLAECVTIDTENAEVTMPLPLFRLMLESVVVQAGFDEAWYLQTNPDVAESVERGAFTSGLAHYCAAGYAEGRRPMPMRVDEEWYRTQYPDVAAAISAGDFRSAQAHFNLAGYIEGRAPTPEAYDVQRRWNAAVEHRRAARHMAQEGWGAEEPSTAASNTITLPPAVSRGTRLRHAAAAGRG
ncbi:MAG TPA: hypothetical protein VME92_01265 [Acetobacteraceae bacterium]|nr:hypothetical protein [Acetobacteraceae bacterium]